MCAPLPPLLCRHFSSVQYNREGQKLHRGVRPYLVECELITSPPNISYNPLSSKHCFEPTHFWNCHRDAGTPVPSPHKRGSVANHPKLLVTPSAHRWRCSSICICKMDLVPILHLEWMWHEVLKRKDLVFLFGFFWSEVMGRFDGVSHWQPSTGFSPLHDP